MKLNLGQLINQYDDRIVFKQKQIKDYLKKGKVRSKKENFNDPENREFMRSLKEFDLI